ncbi:hypothetical protein SH1V18_21740 [Vallitalea longa]|uniref:Stage 0 sporulation protein A homolog n=1 Tax=Vallitalea longa TaxID=2936439 RepID=A0A9W5YD34_9FIRM|nr:response regulator [Vallitalea longa]GKX29694.1 hypothetical protein SH1V18_21740 [Vallitalea longa]
MNIMIVDDEKLLRKGFSSMTDWESKGIRVIGEAMNGKDALNQIELLCKKNKCLDVVITDIKMPVMNGVELTKKIKGTYPNISVIVLSGYDDYSYVRDSMKYGASDYLLKASIDIDNIYETLNRVKINNNSLVSFTSAIDNNEQADILELDWEKMKEYLELRKFMDLKEYIVNSFNSKKSIPINYLQDIMRDLFFFIEYQLEQLGSLNTYLRNRKYINSAFINLIKDVPSAIEWFILIIDEIEKHCTPIDDKFTNLIKDIIKFIEEHYTDNISLNYIADKFYVNKNYLCNIFKAATSNTINEYITDLRIRESKSLIRTSNLSLTEISFQIGYQNHSYFSKIFRKKTGVSPTEYLKLYR